MHYVYKSIDKNSDKNVNKSITKYSFNLIAESKRASMTIRFVFLTFSAVFFIAAFLFFTFYGVDSGGPGIENAYKRFLHSLFAGFKIKFTITPDIKTRMIPQQKTFLPEVSSILTCMRWILCN